MCSFSDVKAMSKDVCVFRFIKTCDLREILSGNPYLLHANTFTARMKKIVTSRLDFLETCISHKHITTRQTPDPQMREMIMYFCDAFVRPLDRNGLRQALG